MHGVQDKDSPRKKSEIPILSNGKKGLGRAIKRIMASSLLAQSVMVSLA